MSIDRHSARTNHIHATTEAVNHLKSSRGIQMNFKLSFSSVLSLVVVALGLAVFTGCGSNHEVEDESDDESIAEACRELESDPDPCTSCQAGQCCTQMTACYNSSSETGSDKLDCLSLIQCSGLCIDSSKDDAGVLSAEKFNACVKLCTDQAAPGAAEAFNAFVSCTSGQCGNACTSQ